MGWRVLKYPLWGEDNPEGMAWADILVPQGSTFLKVISIKDMPIAYFLTPVGARETVWYTFRIFGTGHAISDDEVQYAGTVSCHDGALIWHIFYKVHRGDKVVS
jgi:hypothetical protein